MKEHVTKVKLGINASIMALTDLLHAQPHQLHDVIPSPEIGEPDDTIFIVENLQEALNLVLDARKRLMLLSLYEDQNAKKKRQMEE